MKLRDAECVNTVDQASDHEQCTPIAYEVRVSYCCRDTTLKRR